jgi:hypothetical protein
MTEEQIAVLTVLDAVESEFIEHSCIKAERIGMEKGRFLAVCRKLRDMGYAELLPLFDLGDGAVCGSAYARTRKGETLVFLAGAA